MSKWKRPTPGASRHQQYGAATAQIGLTLRAGSRRTSSRFSPGRTSSWKTPCPLISHTKRIPSAHDASSMSNVPGSIPDAQIALSLPSLHTAGDQKRSKYSGYPVAQPKTNAGTLGDTASFPSSQYPTVGGTENAVTWATQASIIPSGLQSVTVGKGGVVASASGSHLVVGANANAAGSWVAPAVAAAVNSAATTAGPAAVTASDPASCQRVIVVATPIQASGICHDPTNANTIALCQGTNPPLMCVCTSTPLPPAQPSPQPPLLPQSSPFFSQGAGGSIYASSSSPATTNIPITAIGTSTAAATPFMATTSDPMASTASDTPFTATTSDPMASTGAATPFTATIPNPMTSTPLPYSGPTPCSTPAQCALTYGGCHPALCHPTLGQAKLSPPKSRQLKLGQLKLSQPKLGHPTFSQTPPRNLSPKTTDKVFREPVQSTKKDESKKDIKMPTRPTPYPTQMQRKGSKISHDSHIVKSFATRLDPRFPNRASQFATLAPFERYRGIKGGLKKNKLADIPPQMDTQIPGSRESSITSTLKNQPRDRSNSMISVKSGITSHDGSSILEAKSKTSLQTNFPSNPPNSLESQELPEIINKIPPADYKSRNDKRGLATTGVHETVPDTWTIPEATDEIDSDDREGSSKRSLSTAQGIPVGAFHPQFGKRISCSVEDQSTPVCDPTGYMDTSRIHRPAPIPECYKLPPPPHLSPAPTAPTVALTYPGISSTVKPRVGCCLGATFCAETNATCAGAVSGGERLVNRPGIDNLVAVPGHSVRGFCQPTTEVSTPVPNTGICSTLGQWPPAQGPAPGTYYDSTTGTVYSQTPSNPVQNQTQGPACGLKSEPSSISCRVYGTQPVPNYGTSPEPVPTFVPTSHTICIGPSEPHFSPVPGSVHCGPTYGPNVSSRPPETPSGEVPKGAPKNQQMGIEPPAGARKLTFGAFKSDNPAISSNNSSFSGDDWSSQGPLYAPDQYFESDDSLPRRGMSAERISSAAAAAATLMGSDAQQQIRLSLSKMERFSEPQDCTMVEECGYKPFCQAKKRAYGDCLGGSPLVKRKKRSLDNTSAPPRTPPGISTGTSPSNSRREADELESGTTSPPGAKSYPPTYEMSENNKLDETLTEKTDRRENTQHQAAENKEIHLYKEERPLSSGKFSEQNTTNQNSRKDVKPAKRDKITFNTNEKRDEDNGQMSEKIERGHKSPNQNYGNDEGGSESDNISTKQKLIQKQKKYDTYFLKTRSAKIRKCPAMPRDKHQKIIHCKETKIVCNGSEISRESLKYETQHYESNNSDTSQYLDASLQNASTFRDGLLCICQNSDSKDKFTVDHREFQVVSTDGPRECTEKMSELSNNGTKNSRTFEKKKRGVTSHRNHGTAVYERSSCTSPCPLKEIKPRGNRASYLRKLNSRRNGPPKKSRGRYHVVVRNESPIHRTQMNEQRQKKHPLNQKDSTGMSTVAREQSSQTLGHSLTYIGNNIIHSSLKNSISFGPRSKQTPWVAIPLSGSDIVSQLEMNNASNKTSVLSHVDSPNMNTFVKENVKNCDNLLYGSERNHHQRQRASQNNNASGDERCETIMPKKDSNIPITHKTISTDSTNKITEPSHSSTKESEITHVVLLNRNVQRNKTQEIGVGNACANVWHATVQTSKDLHFAFPKMCLESRNLCRDNNNVKCLSSFSTEEISNTNKRKIKSFEPPSISDDNLSHKRNGTKDAVSDVEPLKITNIPKDKKGPNGIFFATPSLSCTSHLEDNKSELSNKSLIVNDSSFTRKTFSWCKLFENKIIRSFSSSGNEITASTFPVTTTSKVGIEGMPASDTNNCSTDQQNSSSRGSQPSADDHDVTPNAPHFSQKENQTTTSIFVVSKHIPVNKTKSSIDTSKKTQNLSTTASPTKIVNVSSPRRNQEEKCKEEACSNLEKCYQYKDRNKFTANNKISPKNSLKSDKINKTDKYHKDLSPPSNRNLKGSYSSASRTENAFRRNSKQAIKNTHNSGKRNANEEDSKTTERTEIDNENTRSSDEGTHIKTISNGEHEANKRIRSNDNEKPNSKVHDKLRIQEISHKKEAVQSNTLKKHEDSSWKRKEKRESERKDKLHNDKNRNASPVASQNSRDSRSSLSSSNLSCSSDMCRYRNKKNVGKYSGRSRNKKRFNDQPNESTKDDCTHKCCFCDKNTLNTSTSVTNKTFKTDKDSDVSNIIESTSTQTSHSIPPTEGNEKDTLCKVCKGTGLQPKIPETGRNDSNQQVSNMLSDSTQTSKVFNSLEEQQRHEHPCKTICDKKVETLTSNAFTNTNDVKSQLVSREISLPEKKTTIALQTGSSIIVQVDNSFWKSNAVPNPIERNKTVGTESPVNDYEYWSHAFSKSLGSEMKGCVPPAQCQPPGGWESWLHPQTPDTPKYIEHLEFTKNWQVPRGSRSLQIHRPESEDTCFQCIDPLSSLNANQKPQNHLNSRVVSIKERVSQTTQNQTQSHLQPDISQVSYRPQTTKSYQGVQSMGVQRYTEKTHDIQKREISGYEKTRRDVQVQGLPNNALRTSQEQRRDPKQKINEPQILKAQGRGVQEPDVRRPVSRKTAINCSLLKNRLHPNRPSINGSHLRENPSCRRRFCPQGSAKNEIRETMKINCSLLQNRSSARRRSSQQVPGPLSYESNHLSKPSNSMIRDKIQLSQQKDIDLSKRNQPNPENGQQKHAQSVAKHNTERSMLPVNKDKPYRRRLDEAFYNQQNADVFSKKPEFDRRQFSSVLACRQQFMECPELSDYSKTRYQNFCSRQPLRSCHYAPDFPQRQKCVAKKFYRPRSTKSLNYPPSSPFSKVEQSVSEDLFLSDEYSSADYNKPQHSRKPSPKGKNLHPMNFHKDPNYPCYFHPHRSMVCFQLKDTPHILQRSTSVHHKNSLFQKGSPRQQYISEASHQSQTQCSVHSQDYSDSSGYPTPLPAISSHPTTSASCPFTSISNLSSYDRMQRNLLVNAASYNTALDQRLCTRPTVAFHASVQPHSEVEKGYVADDSDNIIAEELALMLRKPHSCVDEAHIMRRRSSPALGRSGDIGGSVHGIESALWKGMRFTWQAEQVERRYFLERDERVRVQALRAPASLTSTHTSVPCLPERRASESTYGSAGDLDAKPFEERRREADAAKGSSHPITVWTFFVHTIAPGPWMTKPIQHLSITTNTNNVKSSKEQLFHNYIGKQPLHLPANISNIWLTKRDSFEKDEFYSSKTSEPLRFLRRISYQTNIKSMRYCEGKQNACPRLILYTRNILPPLIYNVHSTRLVSEISPWITLIFYRKAQHLTTQPESSNKK